MADLDPISPTQPIRPIGQEPRREQPARERQPPRKPPADDVTDDMGDRREEPPLVDDFA